MDKKRVDRMYQDLANSFNEPTTSLVEASENYRLVAAGSLALLRQILELGLED